MEAKKEKHSILENFESKMDWKLPLGQIVPAETVLVLAPHHDDEAIGCGGTILRYIEAGCQVYVIYMTDGRYGLINEDKIIRRREALNAWKGYCINQIFWDYEDSHLYESDAHLKLASTIKSIKPDVIFTPWIFDTHRDHKATSYFLSEALEHLNKDEIIVGLYEIMSPLYANRTINITKQIDKKLKIIEAYKSQISFLNIREIVEIMSVFRAKMIHLKSIKAAEAFYFCKSDNYKSLINYLLT